MLGQQILLYPRDQSAGLLDTAGNHLLAVEQRLADRQRFLAIDGGEILISAAHRQTIGVAQRRAGDHLDWPIKSLNHRSENAKLLEILLTKTGDAGLNDVEEFSHHLAHTAEMPGAVLTLQHAVQQ